MIYINQFIDRLRAAETRSQREFVMTMQEARNLHADITKLLMAINQMQTNAPAATTSGPPNDDTVITGGSF